MTESEYRLGDLIDDYCPRCRLLLNHAVASLVDGKVVKVICQTCYSEHAYRHGEGGKKKKPSSGRTTLFEQVLSKTAPPTEPQTAPRAETSEVTTQDQKKKRSAVVARYISRHKTRPPRKSH